MCPTNVICRLCLCADCEFKELFDDSGQYNEIYEIAAKYFDQKLLGTEICLECWYHINEFHTFQQSVLDAQKKFEDIEDSEKVIKLEVVLIDQDDNDDDNLEGEMNIISFESDELKGYNTFRSEDKIQLVQCSNKEKSTSNPKCKEEYANITDEINIMKLESDDSNDFNAFSYDEEIQLAGYSTEENSTSNPKSKKETVDLKDDMIVKVFESVDSLSFDNEILFSDCSTKKEIIDSDHDIIALKQHRENHYESEHKFKCTLCDRELKYSLGLISEHMKNCHKDENKFKCTICDRVYKNAHVLREHVATHIEAKVIYHCPHCPTKFIRKNSINRHIKNKHPKKITKSSSLVYKPKILKFDGVENYESVLKEEEENYNAIDAVTSLIKHKYAQKTLEYCPTKFGRKAVMHRNKIKKLNLKKYTKFSVNKQKILLNEYDLQNCDPLLRDEENSYNTKDASDATIIHRKHTQQINDAEDSIEKYEHSDESKFKCSMCDREYKYAHGLREHEATHMGVTVIYQCPHCPTKFIRKTSINRHIKNKHPRKIANSVLVQNLPKILKVDDLENCDSVIKDEDEENSVDAEKTLESCSTQFKRTTCIRRYIKNLQSKKPTKILEVDDLKNCDAVLTDDEENCNTNYVAETLIINHKHKQILESENLIKRHKHTEKMIEFDAIIAKWKQELECIKCPDTFANFALLYQHFKCEHPNDKFYILCCEYKLTARWQLAEHIKRHLDPNAFKCEICGKCSIDGPSLKNHIRRLHSDSAKERQFECKVCQKRFLTNTELKVHSDIHSTQRNHICKLCEKAFPSEQRLRKHGHNAHNAKRLCDQCGKSCHGIYAYEQHMAEHAGIKLPKYPCDICGAQLKSRSTLNTHKRLCHHDCSTVYVCSECGKKAATKNALKLHKKNVHGDRRELENKFRCTICFKGFKYPLLLREHTATHTGESPHQCPHCPIKIKTKANMYRHLKNKHPRQFEESRRRPPPKSKIDLSLVVNEIVI